MEIKNLNTNIRQIEDELNWLTTLIENRFATYFETLPESESADKAIPPELDGHLGLGKIVKDFNLNETERMILALAIAPSLRPQMLDIFFTRNKSYDRGFTEFGGVKGEQHGGFLPTGETATFIAGGNDMAKRLEVVQILSQDHVFYRHDLIRLQSSKDDEPRLSGTLVPGPELLHKICYDKSAEPEYNHRFPAQKLVSIHEWEDLVLHESVLSKLNEITAWIDHQSVLMDDWGLSRNLKPGYRSLFYGSPGTGKTMAAGLIGKSAGREQNKHEVYRVDLSMVVSKYIGETEKNLSRIFDRAEHQNWILFFDEADSLFGQRTQTKSSNDRYSNQEVSYLLQRIESFNGVILLATNLKENIDEAFTRRFQSVIHFPVPDKSQRFKLWKNILGNQMPKADDIDLMHMSENYELAGGSIINAVRFGALMAVQRKNGEAKLTQSDLIEGISRELKKQGKSII